MEPIIKTENLKVIYNLGKSNEVRALDGVSIEIWPQEYVVFFGPSGCGKSTLLYSILGLQRPTYGKIFIKGKDTSSLREKELVQIRRLMFGMVFQAYYLIPSLDIFSNVALPQIFLNEKPYERRKKIVSFLQRFNIYQQIHKLPSQLSGGQQQRAAIARALINNPSIVLADEPVGNLDSVSAKVVMETFKEINNRDKKTIILVTHDPRYLHFAHRVYHLRDGKVVREVVNPERTQIKEVSEKEKVATEIERLARLYPYANQAELKAKALANYLTQEITEKQQKRLEDSIKDLLKDKITPQRFFDILDMPLEKGGVGLYKQTAAAFTKKIEEILEEAKRYKLVTTEPEKAGRETLIIKLRQSLLDNYKGHISFEQLERLEKAIEDRISGALDKKGFQKQLDLPLNKGGVGLNRATARNFTRKLEIILAQAK